MLKMIFQWISCKMVFTFYWETNTVWGSFKFKCWALLLSPVGIYVHIHYIYILCILYVYALEAWLLICLKSLNNHYMKLEIKVTIFVKYLILTLYVMCEWNYFYYYWTTYDYFRIR